MSEPFDENNPWHVQADHLLAFVCNNRKCQNMIKTGDLPDNLRNSAEWEELCVALSNLAKSRGWTCIGHLQFLCSTCSKNRENSNRDTANLTP
jgi:hypothetical protein